MRRFISLLINGQHARVSGADAVLTLSDYLRLRRKMTGTKIVCSEGDCGSCSVLVGKVGVGKVGGDIAVDYRPIDSCIRFMFQLDGCHVVTIEGIGDEHRLSRVQQAMVDCHGSQCGFCTPGFVMAMTGMLEASDTAGPTVTDDAWRTGLTGNLCRCTGYTPILNAARQCEQIDGPSLEESYSTPGLRAQHRQACEASATSAVLIATDSHLSRGEGRSGNDGTRRVFCPTTIEQAVAFLAEHPDAKIVAGATDVGVQFNKRGIAETTWLDLSRVSELQAATVDDGTLVAGATTTWHEMQTLAATHCPAFEQIVAIFGSPQIRNVGTIGGNIINASPIADSSPFLFVSEATLELTSATGVRTVNVNDFYQGFKQFDLRPGELLTRVRIPLLDRQANLRLFKVSRRKDMDISTFTAAIRMRIESGRIVESGIAYGAVGPTAIRLRKTEDYLQGRDFSESTMRDAGEVASREITPISDVRGGDAYRYQLGRNVLLKYFHEVNAELAVGGPEGNV